MKSVKSIKYKLTDFWDRDNVIDWEFDSHPKAKDKFKHRGVTYLLLEVNPKKKTAMARMWKYRLPDTSGQFVHKCPAKKNIESRLGKDDIIKLQDKYTDKQIAEIRNHRVKIRYHGAQLKFRCPFCKTLFYKKKVRLPDPVQVTATMSKRKLKPRS